MRKIHNIIKRPEQPNETFWDKYILQFAYILFDVIIKFGLLIVALVVGVVGWWILLD